MLSIFEHVQICKYTFNLCLLGFLWHFSTLNITFTQALLHLSIPQTQYYYYYYYYDTRHSIRRSLRWDKRYFHLLLFFTSGKKITQKQYWQAAEKKKKITNFFVFLESTLKHSCELNSVSAWNLPGNSSNITGEVMKLKLNTERFIITGRILFN